MPELGGLARHAEARLDRLRAGVAVDDPVDVAVTEGAVDEGEAGVLSGPGEGEVGLCAERAPAPGRPSRSPKTLPFPGADPRRSCGERRANSAWTPRRLGWGCRSVWPADDRGAGLDQIADLAQDGERHVPAVGVERQQAVAHTRLRRDPAVRNR
ncbi:MAG: hypothetical protein MZU84_08540 [Sphingobacterium sp.]|nr:hypothetical protein [Sphingobacterium sp.]